MKSLKLSLSLYPRIYFGLFLIIGLVLGRYVFPVNEPEMWKASCPERETLYAFKVRTWEPQGFLYTDEVSTCLTNSEADNKKRTQIEKAMQCLAKTVKKTTADCLKND
jgi:hypothetical protein